MRPCVGVLSWHSTSSCSLVVFLFLVSSCFFCFLFGSSRTARHLFVRALPTSSIQIHCIPYVAWDVQVTVGFLIEVEYFCNISFFAWGMVIAQSASCHPSSTRSSISSLCFPSCFGRGGGRNDIDGKKKIDLVASMHMRKLQCLTAKLGKTAWNGLSSIHVPDKAALGVLHSQITAQELRTLNSKLVSSLRNNLLGIKPRTGRHGDCLQLLYPLLYGPHIDALLQDNEEEIDNHVSWCHCAPTPAAG